MNKDRTKYLNALCEAVARHRGWYVAGWSWYDEHCDECESTNPTEYYLYDWRGKGELIDAMLERKQLSLYMVSFGLIATVPITQVRFTGKEVAEVYAAVFGITVEVSDGQ